MAYIARSPAYGSFEKQALTADSSTTTFTLNFTVGSTASLMVSVAGVLQEPETAYNIASGGTQIVFTAAPESGDTVFIVFLGIAYDVGTLIGTGAITGQTAETSVADDDLILIFTWMLLDFISLMMYGLAARKIAIWLKGNPRILNTISACVLIIIAIIVAIKT